MTGEKLLIGLTCPSCGGQITLEEGEALVCCQYCGSYFSLDAEEGIGKVIYKAEKTRDAAIASVKEWMGKGGKAKDLATTAVISEVSSAYLPFWRLIGRGKACVCGYTEHHDKDGTHREPHEALINREYIHSHIACDAGDLGIRTIKVPAQAKAVAAETVDVPVFAVTVSKADGYQNAYNGIISQAIADGARRMKATTFTKGFCIPRGFTLVYYPFYILRYEYKGRNYLATVDGITGKVVSGRAPGNAGRQSWFAACSAISGALAGVGIFLISRFLQTDVYLYGGIGCIIVAILLLIFCWKQFRDGGEVITGDLKGRAIKDGKRTADAEAVASGMFDHYN
ncbi:MAG TPA: hypothetical protein O0X27_02135 [Methanocorpusculum sp.]|nr:hypothetical protein [Methanocorpusculum sp.]